MPTIAALALANFLGTLSVGIGLSRGLTHVASIGSTRLDSFFCYLASFLLALAISGSLRKHLDKLLPLFTTLSLLSIVALYLLAARGQAGLLFAGCLVLLFTGQVLARGVRSERAGRFTWTPALPLTELSFSGGVLGGMAIERFFLVESGSATLPFVVSAATVVPALLLDLAFRAPESTASATSEETVVVAEPLTRAFAFDTLRLLVTTLGVQTFLTRLSTIESNRMPFAAFEVGVTIAPLFAARWSDLHRIPSALARVFFSAYWFPIVIAMLGATALVIPVSTPASFFFCMLAAFVYEWLALVVIRRLAQRKGGVVLAFSICGVVTATVYLLMLHFASSDWMWGLGGVSFLVALLLSRPPRTAATKA